MSNLEQLQYPIGKFTNGKIYSSDEIKKNIETFSVFPNQLETLVKNWDEDKCVMLCDSLNSPIQPSLQIVNGVHSRLSGLFKTLNEKDWQKTIYHPENKHTFTLAELLALYAWHGSHHLAHLKIISSLNSSH